MSQEIFNQKQYNEKQYVVFKLGLEVFGVDISLVKEIIVYQETTQIPGSGRQIEGIINLRGSIIPIYDMRKKFGFMEKGRNRSTRIVVVEVNECTVGIVVDGVSEVLMIPGSVVEQPSDIISSDVDVNYVNGIAKMEEGLIIILDLEKVVGDSLAKVI